MNLTKLGALLVVGAFLAGCYSDPELDDGVGPAFDDEGAGILEEERREFIDEPAEPLEIPGAP